MGCLALGEGAAPAKKVLADRLDDPSPDVRVAAAETLCVLGQPGKALGVLRDALDHENEYVRLYAANALDNLDQIAQPLLNVLEQKMNDPSKYVVRVMEKAIPDLK